MPYYNRAASDVLDDLQSSEKGLHQIYAEARLKRHGPNHLRLSRRSMWQILIAPFATIPMAIVLLVFAVSVTLSDTVYTTLLAVIVILNAGLRYWQSFSHERVLHTLESEVTGLTTVRRDGIEVRIPASELVPGDIVLLSAGERVPADGRLLHSLHLLVNQLQLTGETDVASKHSQLVHDTAELTERHNMVYRGTYVVEGTGQFIVTATGNRTEYGRVLQRAAHMAKRGSLERKIHIYAQRMTFVGIVFALGWLVLAKTYGVDTPTAIAYSLAIIVAAIPVMLPFAVAYVETRWLAILLRRSIIIRHTHALEPLSLVSMIVSDKTGMLTRESIKVVDTWTAAGVSATDFGRYCRLATLDDTHMCDAHDSALHKYVPHTSDRSKPLRSFHFEQATHMSGNLWHHGSRYRLVIKGAPERILRAADLSSNEQERAHLQLQQLAAHGHQVLAIAWCELAQPINGLHQLPKRQRLHFLGFVAFAQNFTADAKRAVATAHQAGIGICMVTGDHVETAYSIGHQLGIAMSRHEVFDARKLSVVSDNELGRIVRTTKVFARATPAHKHRILSALRRQHVVAITGDSTDDIPALMQAHIGITTSRSSLLAEDASDIILRDNNFMSIFRAIRWARSLTGNIRRMCLFAMAASIAEIALLAGSLVLFGEPALLPSQLLWINLVAGLALLVPLGFEPHSRHIMERLPVAPRAPLLPSYLLTRMYVLAVTMAGAGLAIMFHYQALQGGAYSQTLVFTAFVAMLVVSVLSARSDHTSTIVRFRTSSPYLYCGILITIILQLALLLTLGGAWLGISMLDWRDVVASSTLAVVAVLLVSEAFKWHSRRTVRAAGRSYT